MGLFYFSSGGSSLIHLWPDHLESLRRPAVLQTAHAADQVERIAVQSAIFQIRIVDANRDDFAESEAAAGGCWREGENLMKPALEADRRFRDSRRPHDF